jgi:hypothetical protein
MLDGIVSSFFSFIVHKAITLGVATFIDSDLARQDVTESREGIVESLVVDGHIQVLDKDVAGSSLAERGITLRPHDTARLTLDQSIVEGFQSTFA